MTLLPPGSIFTLDGREYMVQDDGAAWSLEMPNSSTLRFEVQQGDHVASDPITKNRSEIAMQGVIKDGTPMIVSYGIDIEPGAANTASFCILGQFHPAQGTSVAGLGPPLWIGLVGERMTVNLGYTTASGTNVTKTLFIDTANIVRGHYYAMKLQVTFDPYGNGHLVITRDGLPVLSYTGPLGWKGETGVYWKEGIYRATSPETLAVDYQNLSLTTSAVTALSATTGTALQAYTQYDSFGHKTTSVTIHTDGSSTTNKYNLSGTLIQSRVVHANGSSDIFDYHVTSQSYISDHRVYNTAGALIEFVAVNADGSKAIDNYLISGKPYTSDHLNYNTSGLLNSAIYHNADGSTTTDKYASTGGLIQQNIVYTDAWRDVKDYGMTGKSYISDERVYAPSGTLIHFLGIGADGSKLVENFDVTGKTYSSDQLSYNPSGVLTLAVYHNNDRSIDTYKYTATGSLSQIFISQANGWRDVYDFGITGQSYVSDHRVYNSAGALSEFIATSLNGAEKAFAYVAGVTLSGSPGSDVFYAHGGDAFVFKGSFGRDVVNYFHAGDLSNHDFLEFAATAVPDFAHLHMTQLGSNVVITIDASDSVTLVGTQVASLTAHDFIFL